ncbi:MAG: rhomboid family intramembrane serine protease [Candidatus Krumholzibacteriota bacterium]|nr:rhomboid family intramembrane serine protease [Candidatus Krumholzibacteriota bacterium]
MQYYYRGGQGPFSNLLRNSIVMKIVIANVIVYFLQILLARNGFNQIFALYPRLVITRGYIWQLVTYMFLHGGLFHLAFNMLIIWMFGSALEQVWGERRFLQFYIICGIGGAVFSFIFSFNNAVIGASGAGYGILLAYAVLFPYNQIYVWGIIPMRARTLVMILAAVEFFNGITQTDGIAHFAHLGGMAAGLLYMKTDHRGGRIWSRLGELFKKIPVSIKFESSGDKEDLKYDSNKVDSILDKISEKGYENLSETEKRILEKYSRDNQKQ